MVTTLDVKLTKAGLNINETKTPKALNDLHYYIIFDDIYGLSFCPFKEEDSKLLDLLAEMAETEWQAVSLRDSQPNSKTFRLIVRANLDDIDFNKTEIEIVAIGSPKLTNEGEEECRFLDITTVKWYNSEEEAMNYLD